MRIVHLYKDYFPPVHGGIEQTVSRMARGAVRAGHDVTVLTSAHGSMRGSEEVVDGVRIIRCPEWLRIASTPICPTMPGRFNRLDVDVVHLHFPSPPGEICSLLDGRARPTVVTYHSDIVRQENLLWFYRPVVNAILERAQVVMPTSPQYVQRSPFLRPHLTKCAVVPHGVELERYENLDRLRPRAQALRRRYGTPLTLFVGRFRYYKGLDTLLRAMPRVRGSLVLVGGGTEEPELLRLRARLGLEGRVHLAGTVDERELLAHYCAADVCVLPSTHASEALGMTLIEALASGRPAVSTELGTGTSFVNVHGETGLVVPPGDSDALADALDLLLADPERREQLGRTGRRRVHELFSADRMIASVLDVYDAVTSGAELSISKAFAL